MLIQGLLKQRFLMLIICTLPCVSSVSCPVSCDHIRDSCVIDLRAALVLVSQTCTGLLCTFQVITYYSLTCIGHDADSYSSPRLLSDLELEPH